MQYLTSSITIRIMDILGIASKDMPDIRNENFLVKKEKNIWALKGQLNESYTTLILYAENDGMKYMCANFDPSAKDIAWVCLICGDLTEEEPDLNKAYVLHINDGNYFAREANTIELAHMLTAFEMFRNFFSGWSPYQPKDSETEIIKAFMRIIVSEEENDDEKDTTKEQ